MTVRDKEKQVMRSRAGVLLDQIANLLWAFGPEDCHFKGAHEQWKQPGHALSLGEFGGPGFVGLMKNLEESFQPVIELGYRILVSIARDNPVGQGDLDALTRFLDKNTAPVTYRRPISKALSLKRPDRPYSRGGRHLDVVIAEMLLEYMNLADVYGRVHWICQRDGCGTLMTGGRGGKKYCCGACRKAVWAYENKKEYYDKNKKAARNIHKENRSTNGATRGRKIEN